MAASFLLQESGSKFLLEEGVAAILLETSQPPDAYGLAFISVVPVYGETILDQQMYAVNGEVTYANSP